MRQFKTDFDLIKPSITLKNSMENNTKTILNSEEAAEYLGICRDKLLDLFNAGKIPGKRITPKLIRFHRGQLDEFIINGGNTDLLVDPVIKITT